MLYIRPYAKHFIDIISVNSNKDPLSLVILLPLFIFFFVFFFLLFLGPLLRHMEVPRLGVESEL